MKAWKNTRNVTAANSHTNRRGADAGSFEVADASGAINVSVAATQPCGYHGSSDASDVRSLTLG